ncbi:MAG: universal stress protein [Humidesulfovibrio sp.]|jgi:nucleotide-binding universal stress UspA family protein|uniref:universal stress protein n=1 Tax=Humidesulfovibrio sp. TaxID=2910988 RepID=UPI002736A165|nr:universal stress protein [Humidesulfovibrio sp.]MDP2847808.1 universal stress protein [Humidesulfovibrio sp.]
MKILAAVEHSTYSTKALTRAVDLAKKDGAELTALTVAELTLGMVEVFPDFSFEEKLLEQAQVTSDKAKEYAQSKGVALQTIVETSSSAGECILANAEKIGADLIVLGSRGKKGVERFLLGSVATKVAAHASCSVLIVR